MIHQLKIFLITIFLFCSFKSNGQNEVYWSEILAVDSVSFITSIVNDVNGNFDISYTRNAGLFANAYGNSRIAQYNSAGSPIWTLNIQGKSRISEIEKFGNSIYFVGDAQNSLTLGQYNVPPNSFFLGKLTENGTLEWVVSSDSLDSYNSKMAIDENGNIHVSVEASFRNSYILKYDPNGVLMHIEYLPELILGDICMDDNNNLYAAGMALGNTTIDSLNISPPGTYVNSIMKFDQNLNAKWINYSNYVSFDYHQRVIYWNTKILTFNRSLNSSNNLGGAILTYDLNGNEINRDYLNIIQQFPTLEFAKSEDKLGIIYDAYNFSNPNIDDTLRIEIFDDQLFKLNEHEITGQIPVDFYGNTLFNLALDSCSGIVTSLFTSNEIYFNAVSTSSTNPYKNHLLLGFDNCLKVNLNDNLSAQEISVYPNPIYDQINVDIPEAGKWSMKILTLSGIEIYSSQNLHLGSNEIHMANLNAGIYLLQIHNSSKSQILKKKIVKY